MSDTIVGVGSGDDSKPDCIRSTDSKVHIPREDHTVELTLKTVFDLLQEKSSRWDDIGKALGISWNDRQIIRNNVDGNKLEAVLNKWIESKCSEVTWSHLIKTLEELKLCDLADKVKKHLHDDNHQDGSTSTGENTIPCNKANNQVSKSDFRLFTSSVTSVTETINIMENGDMPPRFISTKESSYKEDKSPTETINNQTDATSTTATDHDAKPVDANDTGGTPQLVISNDGRDPKSTFQQASSRIDQTSHLLIVNRQDKEIVELKQKVQKHEDERDGFIQREKDKLERDRKALEKKEEEFERRMKEERKQLQDDFNLKRRNSEIELQEGIKKRKIEFEKQEKKQKRDATAEKKKISITEKELDEKKEQLKLLEAHLGDERMKLDKEKRWVIRELNTKNYKLRKRHKKKRHKSKQRRDEQEPVRKDEERVHKSSRKVKDKRDEWFWDEDTVLRQRSRENEENPQ